MPDLDFEVTGVKAASRGLVPLIQFEVSLKKSPADRIHSVMLHSQIQIQSPLRSYNVREKEKLVELFGIPDCWGRTLRNCLWTTAATTFNGLANETKALLSVQCTYDLTIAATKYLHSLEGGDVPLLFLFSGPIFYEDERGQLKVQPISWDAESTYKMPVSIWKQIMEQHYPDSGWFYLRRDVFDRLLALKQRQGDSSWDQTMERLLSIADEPDAEIVDAPKAEVFA